MPGSLSSLSVLLSPFWSRSTVSPRRLLPAGLGLCVALLAGCGGGSSGGDAKIRLVNATSEYAAIDLFQSTTQVVSNAATFGATDYASIGEGTYTFDVKSSGSGTTSSSSSRTVSKDAYSSLVAYTTGGALVTAQLSEGEAAPTSGSAKFRLFHTAYTEAGAVDVYLSTTDCSALSSTASATATNVSTFSAYVEVSATAAGTPYHVCVTSAGDKTDLRLDVPSLLLKDQQITTVILVRTGGGVLLHGLAMNQQGSVSAARNTAVRMRVAAAAASAGQVSATVNGVVLASAIASPSIGTYKLVPAGTLSSTLQIAGTTVPATGLTGTAGADFTLLVAGTAAKPTIALLNDDNTPSTSTAKPAKLRLVNALNGVAGAVTLTDDYSPVADSVSFGTASASTNVASSAALARLEASFSGSTLYAATGITLASGRVYTLFLGGDVAAPVGILRVDR